MADRLVAAALQEIAAEGADGCALHKLWGYLQATPAAMEVHIDNHVKQVVWSALLSVPGLSFKPSNASERQSTDPSIQSLQNAENAGIVVIPSQELRDACLGLYDIRHADTQPSQIQHLILERLAKARTEGVTQNQLGKDFKVEGNKLFYILRSLESRGLVVRRSTLVRNKDSVRGGGSIVLTNLVHLTRYARHLTLNSHQRFEISNTSEHAEFNEDAEEGEGKAKQLMINDDVPAMKAICEKLQQAEGKVLVVSDLKLTLGYRMSSGHRAWRRLMKRLKEGGFVTIIEAKVGRKVRSCIQLLKAFNEHEFSSPSSGTGEAEGEQQLKGPKRGQLTEQLVELSVDQQIYDMIDNGGAEGLMMMEVWKRIGLNNKRNYYRIQNMTIKHGILFEAENHKRSTLYRLRTLKSKQEPVAEPEPSHENVDEESYHPISPDSHKRAPQKLIPRKNTRQRTESEQLGDSMVKIDMETDAGNTVVTTLPDNVPPTTIETPVEEARDVATTSSAAPSSVSNFPPPSLFRIGQPYPCLTVTTTSIQREQRILERLQEEKFVVRAELHRWLESISNKKTMMDRKTLTRTLQKLQREGKCKCILLSMPGSTNCGRKRTAEVVLLPSVKVEPDLLSTIHERIRKFDMESRGHGLPRERAPANAVPILTGLRRMKVKSKKAPIPSQDPTRTVTLQANGFVPSKMVRVRMLHYFLWSYTNDILDGDVNMRFTAPRLTDGSGYRVFALMSAIQAMPLEMFLQMVGSNRLIDNLAEKCRQGLCIRDLPEAEQVVLLENSAGGRLAWLLDILRRLKLIRIVIGHGPVMLQDRWHLGSMSISMIEASLTYAMEEHIYIEQPAPQPLPSLTREAYDLTPRARHEFDINTKESLDNYWQTLEYFFSGAEPSIARHAFPGSSVPEVFGLRSWTSLRIMTIDQRNELVRRMNEGGPEKRKSIQECAKIAKDLNLTLEQVLRVSYEKNRRVRLQSLQKTEPSFMDTFTSTHPVSAQAEVTENIQSSNANNMFPSGVGEGTSHTEGDDVDDVDDHVNHISIVTKLKPSRSRRFPWSDKLDRVLFFAYAKQRALLGAKMNRVDWNSIRGLPAAPLVCRRRISILKAESTVKKAILNLCSLLSARYEKYCQLMESIEETPTIEQEPLSEDGQIVPFKILHEQPEYYWDNPEDPSVVSAIDEIIRCKNLVRSCYNKPCHNKRTVGVLLTNSNAEASGTSGNISVDPLQLSSAAGLMQVSKKPPTKPGKSPGTSMLRSRRIRKKTKKKPASLQSVSTEELVQGSVGVANAIEFIKLVFLNTSVNSDDVQLPKAFMDALHQFKESDVFTAFNFLKEHNMVASGQGAQSFVLSDTFYQNAFASRFPDTTAEESLAMSRWLQDHKTDMTHDWLPYSIEDCCGQLLHLFERASAGELTLGPKLPSEGIGESEDPRSIGCGLKRKAENHEQGARTVKARLEDKDEVYQAVRRERGFPGIEVLLHRESIPLPEMLMEWGVSESIATEDYSPEEYLPEDDVPLLEQELLDLALKEIEKSGENGLSMKELAHALGLQGSPWDLKQAERCADSLESSGHVKKVNAFDHVRVLAQAYAGRYFLQFSMKKTDRQLLEGAISDSTEASTSALSKSDIADLNTLPILPWLTSNGTLNMKILKGLIRRTLGIVTLNPGISEENLVKRMNVLNPQTGRELLRMLHLDGKLTIRTVIKAPVCPPSILRGLVNTSIHLDESKYTEHKYYYPSPLCTAAL